MRIVFRIHAIQRMFQRGIITDIVRGAIENGKVIEDYPTDLPFPSKLILGWDRDRPIHIVFAENQPDSEIIIITVYEPSADKWNESYDRRKIK